VGFIQRPCAGTVSTTKNEDLMIDRMGVDHRSYQNLTKKTLEIDEQYFFMKAFQAF
jgi:hypothetical protein